MFGGRVFRFIGKKEGSFEKIGKAGRSHCHEIKHREENAIIVVSEGKSI